MRELYSDNEFKLLEYCPTLTKPLYKNFEKMTFIRRMRYLFEYLHKDNYRVYYLVKEKKLLGHCVVTPGGRRLKCSTKRDIVIGPYYIRPEMRRRGYSKKLLSLTLNHCNYEYKNAFDWVDKTNIASCKTSVACGFEPVAELNITKPFRKCVLVEHGDDIVFRYKKKQMNNELVSIITPAYNCEHFIGETIESVINQTYENWEMIIVDDCSTDNTKKVVESYRDTRIKLVSNDHNSGAAVSRNRALKIAKGRWIAFLDSDDLWKPQKLEKQIRFMLNNGYHFSCTARETIDENSEKIGSIQKSPKHVGYLGMLLFCWPGCLGTMYDARITGVIQIPDIKKRNDYAIWLKVIKKCDFYYMDEVLAQYRIRQGSISNVGLTKKIKAHYELFRKSEGFNPLVAGLCVGMNLCGKLIKNAFYVKRGTR